MKKLSEVCKITGVTRRTLQEYDKIGLISPTMKNETGYWYYDDAAVQKIIIIQVFVELGYERKEIMKILNSSEESVILELKKMIVELENKKNRIDGMINTLKLYMFLMPNELPNATLAGLSRIEPANLSNIYKDASFKDCLNSSIEQSANYTEKEMEEAGQYVPLICYLLAISGYRGTDPHSESVQACVKEFVAFFRSLFKDEDGSEFYEDEYELANELIDDLQEFLESDALHTIIETQGGSGASEYIIKAVKIYIENISKGE